ncbi:hypothetical protein [Actinoplanes sp. NBRC 101535]|uniref:hypothetical protein n=1 Tax=Actinoplanes sp. NBRC 101535 TaxID=3032196 RepID=UPI0024A19EA2|nr:hypothetical protein [Actinoplanes sp. NBRC 101535]GLY06958.1 hypothetical protein Acsp01_73370 [Actinoplanes sp. NBRC 101535]
MDNACDDALAACLTDPTPARLRVLTGFGPAAYRRVTSIYYGRTPIPKPVSAAIRQRHSMEIHDAWSVIVAAVALAHPDLFVADVAQMPRVGSLEVAVVGRIDRPEVRGLLEHWTDDSDELVREHARAALEPG